jgi:hypothetical protein
MDPFLAIVRLYIRFEVDMGYGKWVWGLNQCTMTSFVAHV